jgi:hypothetical protein
MKIDRNPRNFLSNFPDFSVNKLQKIPIIRQNSALASKKFHSQYKCLTHYFQKKSYTKMYAV